MTLSRRSSPCDVTHFLPVATRRRTKPVLSQQTGLYGRETDLVLWARRFAQTNDVIHRLFAEDDVQLVEDAVEHAGLAVEAVKAPSRRRHK